MLKNKLYDIPQIILLRSDKIQQKLITLLLDDDTKNDNSFYELFDGIRDYYPNNYRLDEMELSLTQEEIRKCGIEIDFNFKKFRGIDYDFSFLDSLYNKFFTQNGANIYAKEEELENYISFITKVSPLQLMGYKLATKLQDKELDVNDVLANIKAYTPLALQVDNLQEYAENHLHLKGAGYLAFNLSKLVSYPTPKEYYKKDFLKQIPRINEFSYINNYSISIGQMVDILKLCKDFIYGSFIDDSLKNIDAYKRKLQKIVCLNKPINLKNNYSIDSLSLMNKIISVNYGTTKMTMLQNIINFYNDGEYAKAYFLENVLFFYIYGKNKKPFLLRMIKLYFHTVNILRSYMLMSQNIGLAHFSEYSGSVLRTVESRNAYNSVSGLIKSGTTHLNAKVGTPNRADKIERNILEFKDIFDRQKGDLKYTFGLSSIKGREKDSISSNGLLLARFYHKRNEIKKETLAIDDFLRNVRYKSVNKFSTALKFTGIAAYEKKSELQSQILDLSALIISVDAVGKETHTPPEVFSPHFRYLRNGAKNLKCNIFGSTCDFQYHKNLIFTIHAGEDFNHIITGMRQVDECITFFDLQRRDRLGHVLSLGVKPHNWKDGTQEIMIYKGEYFDNLVWICHQLKYISCNTLDLARYINIYTDKIWKLFDEIYPMYSGKTLQISDLYRAWEYRKNCPITYYQRERKEILIGDYAKCVLDKEPSSKIKELYELYHTNMHVRKVSNEIYRINKNDIKIEELNIWEAIQDKLLNKISNKGIIIETNPSSNVFISSMDSYTYHPIFRFYPPKEKYLNKGKRFNKYGQRNGKVSVTINSDDPAIFVTSLQNEFRTIKNIAIKKYKCSDKEADDWLNEIRTFGLQIFNETYQ